MLFLTWRFYRMLMTNASIRRNLADYLSNLSVFSFSCLILCWCRLISLSWCATSSSKWLLRLFNCSCCCKNNTFRKVLSILHIASFTEIYTQITSFRKYCSSCACSRLPKAPPAPRIAPASPSFPENIAFKVLQKK